MNEPVTLLDVNVLIALCDGNHEHHIDASLWFTQNEKHGWASCPLTQNGAIRIMSLPNYSAPRPIAKVIEQVGQMCTSRHHQFWGDSIEIVNSSLIEHRHLLGHNQITDVYLLALAVQNKGRLLTIDGAIPLQAVKGAIKSDLLNLLR